MPKNSTERKCAAAKSYLASLRIWWLYNAFVGSTCCAQRPKNAIRSFLLRPVHEIQHSFKTGWDHTMPPVLLPKWIGKGPSREDPDDQTQHSSGKTVVVITMALYLANTPHWSCKDWVLLRAFLSCYTGTSAITFSKKYINSWTDW